MEKINYKSPEFYSILSTINAELSKHGVRRILDTDGKISQSKFNIGKYGNVYMWRTTNREVPELMTSGLMTDVKNTLTKAFEKYVLDKTITIGNPLYTTDIRGNSMASIVIMLTQLNDNIITIEDLDNFEAGEENATKKCLEIESRMFKRDGDSRDATIRIFDFADSLIYEPRLVFSYLYRISELSLNHQTDAITLETDNKTDFTGKVDGVMCNIEGKSTRADVKYVDDLAGHLQFAEYFKNRLDSGSLGSVHKADYVLFIIKATGDVICINMNDYRDNWLAGKIDLQKER